MLIKLEDYQEFRDYCNKIEQNQWKLKINIRLAKIKLRIFGNLNTKNMKLVDNKN